MTDILERIKDAGEEIRGELLRLPQHPLMSLVTPKPQERANIGPQCLTFGISSSQRRP